MSEPVENIFNLTAADQIVNLAKKNGQLIRGNNFIDPANLPDWVESGNFTPAELTSLFKRRISFMANRYQGDV